LRHSFASLLIHEGRHSIVDIAAQLGHDATMTLSTYAHVVAELRDAPKLGAEDQIRAARVSVMRAPYGPNAAHEPVPGQLAMFELDAEQQKAPQRRALVKSRRGDSNPRPHHYEGSDRVSHPVMRDHGKSSCAGDSAHAARPHGTAFVCA
jgi:hypothetical protein